LFVRLFVCFFSQGGQLVGLMPVLATCHLIYVFSVVLHCISILFMLWQMKFSLSCACSVRLLHATASAVYSAIFKF